MRKSILGILILFVASCQVMAQQPFYPSDKINALMFYLDGYYVDTLNESELADKAIVKLLEELDPHSYYLSAKELKESEEPLQGNFEGIGIQFNIYKDTILVVSPISGGPSEKLGIRSGDKFIYIDDSLVAGKKITNNDVFKKLRGKKGTKVNVKVLRSGEKDLLSFDIIRDKIPIFSVDASYMIAPGVGYIKVNRFAATTAEECRAGILQLKAEGATSLILDLSDNSGGYLTAAVDLADEFLKSGELLVYTEGTHSPRQDYKATARGNFETGKVIVLINEGSASASEIVSGALQDLDRAVIVGRRSFGKGLVQNTFPFPDGSAVRLTTARYFTPSGRFIQSPYGEGSEKYYENLYSRFKNGELTDAHTIEFPDSLKYTTRNKRVVYGGGGIMPDYFIALDTSFYSDYLINLNRKNVFYDYALEYVLKNRESLLASYPDYTAFATSFDLNDEMLEAFQAFGTSKEVTFDLDQWTVSEKFIRMRIKAAIASDLYDRAAFFKVYNSYDPTIQKALEIISDKDFDKKLLNSDKKEK